VSKDRDDVDLARLEEYSRDEPEFVSTDIEHHACPNQIGVRKNRLGLRQILPIRFLCYAIPVIEWLSGRLMSTAEYHYRSMAYYPHVQMFS
jgi:hypothetical protein